MTDLLTPAILCLFLCSAAHAELDIIDEGGAALNKARVPVLRHKSDGRTIACYLTVYDVIAGERQAITATVNLSNWNNETVGNSLYIEECDTVSCRRDYLSAAPNRVWMDGGNITPDMNHAVYHPSAKFSTRDYIASKTYAVSVASYSTGYDRNPKMRVNVDVCDINVERRRP